MRNGWKAYKGGVTYGRYAVSRMGAGYGLFRSGVFLGGGEAVLPLVEKAEALEAQEREPVKALAREHGRDR